MVSTLSCLYTTRMNFDSIIENFSYIGIFVLMFSNGMVNFPSSQILYIIVGYFVGAGKIALLPSVISGALGNALGNIVTFLLVKKYGEPLAQKLLFVDKQTFSKVVQALRATLAKRGLWWIGIGKLIPSVKAFIPIVAGLAKVRPYLVSVIFFITSFIWAYALTMVGYIFGKGVSLSYLPIVSLTIAVIVVSVFYKKFYKEFSK